MAQWHEGGIIFGHRGVRDYWTRQWGMIDPSVEPGFTSTGDGRVEVHQVVRDLAGKVVKDQVVRHVYAFEDGLIRSMEIREGETRGRLRNHGLAIGRPDQRRKSVC